MDFRDFLFFVGFSVSLGMATIFGAVIAGSLIAWLKGAFNGK
jgi:hypothetical protein